jgi:hypothetical protein
MSGLNGRGDAKEPDMDEFLDRNFAEDGWTGLEQDEQIRQEQQEKITQELNELAEKYAVVLDNDETSPGRKMFEDLLDRTLRQPTYGIESGMLLGSPNETIDDPEKHALIREGQNQIVRFMLNQINRHRNLSQKDDS